ncbi:MAG: hypothetical protein U9M92_01535 [Patescibacteria group bacterium]|nr:hypothetical protein [Patescibacteria group bacterium]
MGRRIFIVVLLLVVLLAGGLFSLWYVGDKSLQNPGTDSDVPFYLQEQGDSDNDGLADWEELLWGSDLDNPDTDGDGTVDGAEVLADRSPTKPGPGDQLIRPEERAAATLGQALKERTKPLLKLEQEELAQRQTSYRISDLNIVATNQATLEAYTLVFVGFLRNMRTFSGENAVGLALAYDENSNPAIITKLIGMSNFFQQRATRMSGAAVPQSAAATHLDVVNSLQDLSNNIRDISRIPNEPVLAFQSTQVYTGKAIAVAGAIAQLDRYFYNQGIDLDQYK